ncbi:uncharacterized protein F5147DRAFT_222780 [Suillus discolor]|uniref:Uncharacterized protein n=1 Tax=Suillus discolor TaxID=1912936 RepID=A0A9P7F5D1_9AGAM|nr:uncharacterized protein F5147DRAFT_222780 [Suillus discolor]KAG2106723.1 hypothetical protein F5147DRAFT_222780 [Suillus discolor]
MGEPSRAMVSGVQIEYLYPTGPPYRCQCIHMSALLQTRGVPHTGFVLDHHQQLGPVFIANKLKNAALAHLIQSLFEQLVVLGNRPIRIHAPLFVCIPRTCPMKAHYIMVSLLPNVFIIMSIPSPWASRYSSTKTLVGRKLPPEEPRFSIGQMCLTMEKILTKFFKPGVIPAPI